MLRLYSTEKQVLFIVLSPVNVKKMKDCQPLQFDVPDGCKRVGIVITPDMLTLRQMLSEHPTPEELERVLAECKDLPEVDEPTVVDGVMRLAIR